MGSYDQLYEALAARAEEAEKARRVPQETIEEATALGYFRMLAPKRFGGDAASFAEFFEITRRMARGCPSSAWAMSFLTTHTWLLAKFPPALQEELFAAGHMPMAPAPLAPTGKCVAADGGYRVTGRWEWATGVMHADWVMVTCLEDNVGPRFCVLPMADVTVEDNWYVAGMCATGSNAVRVQDTFVPAHRTMEGIRLRIGKTPGEAMHPDDARIRYPMGPTLALVAATPALGAAEGALEAFTARMKEKQQAYSPLKQGDLPVTHLRLGEATALVRAAASVWRDAIAHLDRIGPLGNEAPLEDLAAIRLAAASIVRFGNEAANILGAAAGGSSGYSSAPLQRFLRDLQMIRGHVIFDWDRAVQITGKMALGIPPSPMDML